MIPRDLIGASPRRPVAVGRYDVVGVIGAGGMGAVFEAVDREHGTRVALKTLTHLDARSLMRFKSEFRAVAHLSHPNLVSLYELGCHDDLWFFTMERVDGVDLSTGLQGTAAPSPGNDLPTRTARSLDERQPPARPIVERVEASETTPNAPRSMPQVRQVLAQLVRGVRALHAAGLLHLDLKPSNVLLDRNGRVVIVDFGLVRSNPSALDPTPSSDLRSTTVSGTPRWMAPEQYTGIGIGEASDWYAVGLMLYQALTGLHPFPQHDQRELEKAKLGPPPIAPAQLVPGTPDDLSELAMELLRPEPGRRPGGDAVAARSSAEEPDPEPPPSERMVLPLLIDRVIERDRMIEMLGQVQARGTAVVHLVGPSGVGKTALLDALLSSARTSGALALRGRCYERETVPYKAFEGLLEGLANELTTRDRGDVLGDLPTWIHELSRMFPVLSRVPVIEALLDGGPPPQAVNDRELRRRATEALRELLTSLALRRPLVLGVDDLQWADADSTSLLARLLESPAPRGLLLAATFRPEEAAANLAIARYLDTARALSRQSPPVMLLSLDVGPLSRDAAEQLAVATLAARNTPADGISATIAEEAAGNPFFIEELAHHAAQQREAGVEVTRASVALEQVLARRIQSLSPEERALVEVLAVANSPIPLAVAFAVARIQTGGVLRALWSLRGGHFVRSTGVRLGDRIELHHDRMRESVLGAMAPERVAEHHLALGLALANLHESDETGPWLFDAVRHLNTVPGRVDPARRQDIARLNLRAGQRARAAAAFPLAFGYFLAGAQLLDEQTWTDDYDLALALHGGAAESAYLDSSWQELDRLVTLVKQHGRTVLDQLIAWEAQIDGFIARNEYDSAVDTALEALRLLGVELPAHPGQLEIGAELQRAHDALATTSPAGLEAMPMVADPTVAAAMRIQTRIGSATYFARPKLFLVLACRQVATSVEHGLAAATPFALSVYGIVLNSLGRLHEAHGWGRAALALIERIDDRSLEARTRHVVHDMVCTWTVPLASTLDDLCAVVAFGKRAGDLEYAAYAAHACIHNSFYASRPLAPLLESALEYGAFMRGHQQVNALHVHVPFEQALRCFIGHTPSPGSLDGEGFSEQEALRAAEASGSRSAQCLIRLLMGIVRYHFVSPAAASEQLETALQFLDGLASTWHIPMLHQYAALAIHALPTAQREALRPRADASLAVLRALAEQGPANFAHRVHLVSAERARADGDTAAALALARLAADGARAGDWFADLGLAHELAARCHLDRGDLTAVREFRRSAAEAYLRWGARAKFAAILS